MTTIVKQLKLREDAKETETLKKLLPSHYTCEARENGVHCYSEKGISESNKDEAFDIFMRALSVIFGDRLMEVFHQTCTNHVKFTVYLRKSESV